ncbi:MAG: crossover junction endodeoxyribonuclease RuvC [Anaerolineaceae bacterium]|nr:crossover junction endodeoxyribonuclease RuvC [Anaerolineaceae bacterium]
MRQVEGRSADRIILGLDPGLARLGFAVIVSRNDALHALCHGVFRTDAQEDEATRIEQLVQKVESLIDEYDIDEAALEELFFSRNVSSALKVAQVRGALLFTLKRAGIPLVALAPNTVKRSVCGHGRASKQEVARMSALRLGLAEAPRNADEADALAIAITASQRVHLPSEIA